MNWFAYNTSGAEKLIPDQRISWFLAYRTSNIVQAIPWERLDI